MTLHRKPTMQTQSNAVQKMSKVERWTETLSKHEVDESEKERDGTKHKTVQKQMLKTSVAYKSMYFGLF